MAQINVNLNAVQDDDLHPEGPLHVRIAGSEVRDSKAGSQYIAWRLDPVASTNKRPLWVNTSLKPEALAGLKRFLKAAGFQWDSEGGFESSDAHGLELEVNVGVEEYEGEKRNAVKFPYRPVR